MKRFLFLLLIGSNIAIAQQGQDNLTSKCEREVIQLLRRQLSANIGELKPTGLKQRVIAQSISDGINSDSTAFEYSGMRGSRFDFNLYYYDPVLENAMEPDAFSILADSISSFRNDTIRYVDYAYYRAENKTDSLFTIFLDEIYDLDSTKMINVYDGNGTATHTYYFSYDPVTSDTNAIIQYNYDITHTNKLTDTVWGKESGSWLLGSTNQYHYNSLNQLDTATGWGDLSGTPTMLNKSIYTYYPDGKLRTRLSTIYLDGTYFYSYSDTFGYTSGIDYCTWWQSIRTTDFGNGGELLYSLSIKYPGINGNPDSTKLFTKNTASANWTPKGVYRYTYNSYDNPDEILYFQPSNTSGTPDQRRRFYYETYDDGLSIKDVDNDNTIMIYPNPFNSYLDIEWKERQNQKCKIKLVNLIGQEILSVTSYPKSGKLRLPVSQLANGFYSLLIEGVGGRIVSKKLVKK